MDATPADVQFDEPGLKQGTVTSLFSHNELDLIATILEMHTANYVGEIRKFR